MFRFNLARACALAAAVVVPGGCSGGDGTTTPTTPAGSGSASSTSLAVTPTTEAVRVIEVTYVGGQVAGGAQRTAVRRGEKVRIRVTSDVADEVHVHTYDRRAAVAPGQVGQVELVASIPGRHEVELENRRRQLLVLEVR